MSKKIPLARQAIRLMVDARVGLSPEITRPLLDLELSVFGTLYRTCPSTIEALKRRYGGREIVAVFLLLDDRLVAARLFGHLSEIAVESMAMMVEQTHRGRGVANLLCDAANDYLGWRGVHYITSWTHVTINAAEILAKRAPIISREPELNATEKSLLRRLESQYCKPNEAYGNMRRVPNYYDMVDGSIGDANFWVHEIASGPGEPPKERPR